jgi:hypothetical protein
MTDLRKAAQQALEALETERDIYREHDEDGAPEYILDAITSIQAALAQPVQPVQEPTDIAALVEGMEVSIDVSTGEHDSDNRLFGTVTLAQENQGSKHGLILLIQDAEPNFQPAPPVQEPCIAKDPRCPCQDGDACHYKDCGDTKAWPVPQAEPVSCRFCHSKKGCYTWLCYSCGEIDDVQQPAAQPEQEPVGKVVEINNDGFRCEFNRRLAVGTKLYTAPPAAQRPWVGLTEDEIKGTWAQLWYDLTHGKLSTPDNEVRNNVVMFGQALEAKLKGKNYDTSRT